MMQQRQGVRVERETSKWLDAKGCTATPPDRQTNHSASLSAMATGILDKCRRTTVLIHVLDYDNIHFLYVTVNDIAPFPVMNSPSSRALRFHACPYLQSISESMNE
jgi:hypothetical protein